MLFGVFLTLGVAMLSVALRSFRNSYSQKAGALGIIIASFLAIFFGLKFSRAYARFACRRKNSCGQKMRRRRIVFLR